MRLWIPRLRRLAPAFVLLTPLALASQALALSVGEAKSKGLVVETSKGYLAPAPGTGSAEVLRLVRETNAARKAKYREIAKDLGVDLGVVEADFGRKLRGR